MRVVELLTTTKVVWVLQLVGRTAPSRAGRRQCFPRLTRLHAFIAMRYGRSELCTFLNGDVALVLVEIIIEGREILHIFGEIVTDLLSRIEDTRIECKSGFNSSFVGTEPDLPLSRQCGPYLRNVSVEFWAVSDPLVTRRFVAVT